MWKIGLVNGRAHDVDVEEKMIFQWEQFLRVLCAEHMLRNRLVIGGPEIVLEVAKIFATVRKYTAGQSSAMFSKVQHCSGR